MKKKNANKAASDAYLTDLAIEDHLDQERSAPAMRAIAARRKLHKLDAIKGAKELKKRAEGLRPADEYWDEITDHQIKRAKRDPKYAKRLYGK